MEFLGISFWEFLVIVVVVLVVLGPSRIPKVMRTLGIIVRNIRQITAELTANISRELSLEDEPQKPEAAKKATPEASVIKTIKTAKAIKNASPKSTLESVLSDRSEIVRNIRKITTEFTSSVAREMEIDDYRHKTEIIKQAASRPPAVKASKAVKAIPTKSAREPVPADGPENDER